MRIEVHVELHEDHHGVVHCARTLVRRRQNMTTGVAGPLECRYTGLTQAVYNRPVTCLVCLAASNSATIPCARSACRAPMQPEDVWAHTQSQDLYCRPCATAINRAGNDHNLVVPAADYERFAK